MKDIGSSSNISADDKSQNITEQGRDPILESIDYLSQLPEGILFHVLSFLTLKESVLVSTLQRKWKHILAKIPTLDFSEFEIVKAIKEEELFSNQHDGTPIPGSPCCSLHLQQVARKKLTELVEQTLLLHSGWPIDNLSLCFCYHVCEAYAKRINSWIQFAFTNNVKNLKLEISITDPINNYLDEEGLRQMRRITKPYPLFVFPSGDSAPKRLETLKLRFCKLSATSFNTFTCLTRLLLKYVNIVDGSIAELVANCPVLEDLRLDTCALPKAFLVSEEDIRIKRLSVIYSDTERRFAIDISTPYLLQLEIVELNFISVSIRNASQLVDATISTISLINAPGAGKDDPFDSLLMCLKHCHTLTVTTYIPMVLSSDSHLPKELPTPLQNLKHLKLVAGFLQIELQRISCLLRSCPNLESLTISLHEPTSCCKGTVIDETPSAYYVEEDGYWEWESQTGPFPCLENSLKTITVNKLEGSVIELRMIKFLAKNARVLKKMVIYPNEVINESASRTPQRKIIQRQQRRNLRRFLKFISTSLEDKVTIIRISNLIQCQLSSLCTPSVC